MYILAIDTHWHLMFNLRGAIIYRGFPHVSCSCTLFSPSLQTHPFNPLQPLSEYFPLGPPECLLFPPFIYCLLLQSLSVEIRRGPPSLSQAEFPHCKRWKWQLSSRGWSAYLSLGKLSGKESQPHWDGLDTCPVGNNRQWLLFRKGGKQPELWNKIFDLSLSKQHSHQAYVRRLVKKASGVWKGSFPIPVYVHLK